MPDDDIIEAVDEEEEEGQEEVASTGLFSSRILKLLTYIGGGIVALIVMFTISYLVVKWQKEKEYKEMEGTIIVPPPPPLTPFTIGEIRVNSNDIESHFIKVNVTLAYDKSNKLLAIELGQRRAQITHIINIILSSKKAEELKTVQDKIDLAEEIKAHINAILREGKIKEVWFTEFIVT